MSTFQAFLVLRDTQTGAFDPGRGCAGPTGPESQCFTSLWFPLTKLFTEVPNNSRIRPTGPNSRAGSQTGPNSKGARSQTGPNSEAAKKSTKETKSAWPKKLPEQIAAVRQALQSHKGPAAPDIIASRFKTVKAPAIEELLDTLVAVGPARQTKDGRYVV